MQAGTPTRPLADELYRIDPARLAYLEGRGAGLRRAELHGAIDPQPPARPRQLADRADPGT